MALTCSGAFVGLKIHLLLHREYVSFIVVNQTKVSKIFFKYEEINKIIRDLSKDKYNYGKVI